jgi:nitroreductase/Fe-S-cluster-containing hydrogenase component 2
MEEKKPTFEELKPMLRPTGVMSGIMKVDPEKCSSCGFCLQNCCFKCWEMDEEKHPRMKESAICFSCFNCMVACPKDAISIVRPYEVKGGFFDTGFPNIKMPLEPKDKDGKTDEWNQVERTILERRSVRNFKKDPVPDHLIRRVLEAGRFAPSGGNHQPWKFTVVTDRAFIDELETACQALWAGMYPAFLDDNAIMNMVGIVSPGIFEPRTQYGFRCTATKELPVFLNAPCVIFLGGNEKLNDATLEIGICGENMNITAASLGLGFCWSNFGGKGVNLIPKLKAKLGFGDLSWNIVTAAVLGYPKFKQAGMVPRHYRPITWFRPGSQQPEIEE